jgi:hypothetical protein
MSKKGMRRLAHGVLRSEGTCNPSVEEVSQKVLTIEKTMKIQSERFNKRIMEFSKNNPHLGFIEKCYHDDGWY